MDIAAFTLVFIPLLVVVNPPASLALFLTLGKDLDRSGLRTIARRACTFAAVVLMVFLVFGEELLITWE
jgi:multiple antibiotic resistance protein